MLLSEAKTFSRAKASNASIYGPVRAALLGGQCAVMNVIGDSTGNETNEWVYRLAAEKIGPENTNVCVLYRLWNDTNQSFDPWVTVQNGSSGRRYLTFDGTSINAYIAKAEVPAASSSDLEMEASFEMDSWTPVSAKRICGLTGGAGDRGWYLQIATTGQPQFIWSADGTNLITETGTATGFTDGTEGRIRVKLDVDNGGGGYTINIDKSSDGGTTWTSLLSKVTSAGTTSIFATTTPNFTFGSAGGSGAWAGKGYEFVVRDGIGGPNRLPVSIEEYYSGSTTVPLVYGGSPTLYVFNGSNPGSGLTYFTDSTRLPKIMPWSTNQMTFLSTRHNDTSVGFPKTWQSTWSSWITSLRARSPFASFVAINQNPRNPAVSTGANGADVQKQMGRAMSLMLKQLNIPVIDVYSQFVAAIAAGTAITTIIEPSDGVHPTKPDGVNIWLDEVWRSIR